MMNIRMVQITFTKEAGGAPLYLKVFQSQLDDFRKAFAENKGTVDIVTMEGYIHTFNPNTIRNISDRPYNPLFQSKRSKKHA